MKCYIVYYHTHVESGRRYIGLTSQTMEKRWKNHIHAAKNSKGGRWHFPNAIRKYGPEAFEGKVIRVFESLEEANLAEKCLIKRWKTRDPKYGFNTAPGGQHTPHSQKNPWDRHEYREKALVNLSKMSTSVTPQQRSIYSRNYWQQPESKEKASLRSKKQWQDPQIRAKNIAAVNASKNTLESKARRSTSAKIQWLDPQIRARNVAAIKTASNTPESKIKRSSALKAKWKDPVARANWTRAARVRSQNEESRSKLKDRWLNPDYRERCSLGLRSSNAKRAAVAAAKTHCKNGHDLNENAHSSKKGCRICQHDRHVRWVLDKRQANL